MKIKSPYRVLGISLATAGAILAPVFYFIVGSPALTATGISTIILGFTCIAVANARPYLSPEAAQMLLKTGMVNIAALLEEMGLHNKAIYLPSSSNNGHPRAMIPLSGESAFTNFKSKLPDRFIVRYGTGKEDMAIAVTTPGSVNLSTPGNRPGPTESEIEAALNYLLTGVLDIAGGATVTSSNNQVRIRIKAARMNYENIWYYRCLGSPIASIAATVVSEAMDKPVRILDETKEKGNMQITLEIIGI
jgi:hypothetical protein